MHSLLEIPFDRCCSHMFPLKPHLCLDYHSLALRIAEMFDHFEMVPRIQFPSLQTSGKRHEFTASFFHIPFLPIQSLINSYRIHRITIFSDGIPPNGHAPPQTPGAFKSSTRPSSCKILGLGLYCEQSSKAAMKLWMIIQERGTNHRKTRGKRWLNGIQWC